MQITLGGPSEHPIDTLTILGPFGDKTDLAEPRGPESNQVRVLPPGRREMQ